MTLSSGPATGSYLISVPASYDTRKPVPLVFIFYGAASSPQQFSNLTHFPSSAANRGSIVVAPHAQGPEWQFSGDGTDSAFVSTVLHRIESTYCVDERKVFATGFSAGAAFTIAYACVHPHLVAAIATVAVEYQLGCKAPLSILAFHGTADHFVRYQDNAVGLSLPGAKLPGTERNMSTWAQLDHCHPAAEQTRISSQVTFQQWRGCSKRATVRLYSILGGGHSWPGADPRKSFGFTTQQINATKVIIAYFAARP